MSRHEGLWCYCSWRPSLYIYGCPKLIRLFCLFASAGWYLKSFKVTACCLNLRWLSIYKCFNSGMSCFCLIYENIKGIIRVFSQNFGVIQCNGQTKVVDATIQRHPSQNWLIFQWWPSKVDLSAIKYFCQPVANTCTNISISPYAFTLASDI